MLLFAICLMSIPASLLVCAVHKPIYNVPFARHRDDALRRLSNIPFVLDYRNVSTLESSGGNVQRYCLTLSDRNDDDDLRRALDVTELRFTLDKLPHKDELTLRVRDVTVTRSARGNSTKPIAHIRVNNWIEV